MTLHDIHKTVLVVLVALTGKKQKTIPDLSHRELPREIGEIRGTGRRQGQIKTPLILVNCLFF